MANRTFQHAARAAFSPKDWLLLVEDPSLRRAFTQLASVEEVEEFVFRAYDRLRALREHPSQNILSESRSGPCEGNASSVRLFASEHRVRSVLDR